MSQKLWAWAGGGCHPTDRSRGVSVRKALDWGGEKGGSGFTSAAFELSPGQCGRAQPHGEGEKNTDWGGPGVLR